MKRILLGLSLAVGSLLWCPTPIKADENFSTTLHTTYTVNSQGQTQVKQVYEFVNKTPTRYAKQYGLKIAIPDLKNVSVLSNGQAVVPEVVSSADQTTIGITFPDELVGEGKKRILEVSYLSPGSAVVSGQILEVSVPSMAAADTFDTYNITLITPGKFGLPSRTTPVQYQSQAEGNQIITTFSPSQGQGVTAIFGQQQIFDLKLRYFLENTSTNPTIAQIALPPDTAYQKISYQVIEPQPQNLSADNDGNWIATYQVDPQSQLNISVAATALLHLDPATNFPASPRRPALTAPQEFWESNNHTLVQQATTLSSIHDIFEFVVNTLSFDFSRLGRDVTRLGAAQALANPSQAGSQEFTDLFIALARSKQIPARRLVGYAHSQNPKRRPLSMAQGALHTWAEFYDESSGYWRPLDPTWQDTTGGVNYFDQFDLNHIVFAINGESSSLPYSVGSYKSTAQQEKAVEVSFSPSFTEAAPQFQVALQPIKVAGIAIPGRNLIHITNQTGQAWYHVRLNPTVENSQAQVLLDSSEIPVVLPYQTIAVPVGLYSSEIGLNQKTALQLTLQYSPDIRNTNQAYDQPTTIQLGSHTAVIGPWYIQTLTNPTGLIGLGICGAIITGLAGSLLVLRRRRSRSVRRKS